MNDHDDHNTTPDEMLLCAIIQQRESIQAYIEKFNAKEKERVQAKTND